MTEQDAARPLSTERTKMDTTETFFGEHPPRDGKSYDCQCARCGGYCEWQECDNGPHTDDWRLRSFVADALEIDLLGTLYLCENAETLTKVESLRWFVNSNS